MSARSIRRRWTASVLLIVVLLGGGRFLWQRYRLPPSLWISSPPPEPLATTDEEPAGPVPFGPAWPPTDAEWAAAFTAAAWIYPLPGPVRRLPTADDRIFGPQTGKDRPAQCRDAGRCGADLGGDLWGEHVYAVQDGLVERVQREGDDRGGIHVRLSHFGGMVFTQYFHLAATPRGLGRGVRVRAGDVIGLLGDSGLTDGRRHLHFALSIRPSARFPEVYWDPQPWMAEWPLRVPTRGTVAGLASTSSDRESPRRRRQKQ